MTRNGAPLSYAQESIWLLDKLSCQQGYPAYNEPLVFHITGWLDVPVLASALRQVTERHAALRTNVVESSGGLVGVARTGHDLLRVVNLRESDPVQAARKADEVLATDLRRPFDLTSDLLLRAVVILLPGDESLLGLTIHHIATDDWSNSIIMTDLGHYYRAIGNATAPERATPAVEFSDHVAAERRAVDSGEFAEKIAAWKARLDGGTDLLRMPLDRLRPAVTTFAGDSARISITRESIRPLLDRCRRECKATDFSVFLAAYSILLNRYTGQESVTVGTTVLNRGQERLLDVVGCFVNTVALVMDVDGDSSFRDLLARTTALTRQMLSQGDVPYANVLHALDVRSDPSHTPVFQTMLTMAAGRPLPDLGPGTRVRWHPVRRMAAKFEILLYITEESESYEVEAEYSTDLYAATTIERFLRHFATLLDSLGRDIDAPVSTVQFTPAEERQVILNGWNNTAVEYPKKTVIDFFEAQAAKTPDAIAVEFEGRSLTYDQLNRAVNQVARFIAGRRPTGGAPFIGVYMGRSLEMVIALVAIVKAGCAYVPIDPEYPEERIAFMVEDSQVSMVLTQRRYLDSLAGAGAGVVVLSADALPAEDDSNLLLAMEPDAPAYMIYTSGSTGRPKGAINRHVSLFNRLYWMQEAFGLSAADRVLQKTPFSFDVSVWEFFWPLMFGARIVVARPGGHRDADYMKRLIKDRRVTTVHFIPSILNVFLEEDELAANCESLRRVICSGEALPYASVQRFYALLSCELHNLYGPTEAAIDVSHWPCTTDYPGAVVPIGTPIANTQLYIVDKHLALQPIGVPGELCIGGIQLAARYHNRPELTDKAFVPNPYGTDRLYRTGDLARYLPDGQIQYLGRIDNQIKLRGVRIEPEEISAALRDLPGVKDAAVVVHESGNSRTLVAYVVASGFDQQRSLEALKSRLPEFMVPQIVMSLPSLPIGPNGKLDRRALPKPGAPQVEAAEILPSRDEHEQAMVRVFREVLGTEQVGPETSFFSHGGDSILTIRAAARLRDLGYPVQVQDVFAHPTARRLATAARDGRGPSTTDRVAPLALLSPDDLGLIPEGVVDGWPLAQLQAGMIYHAMLAERTPVYHDVFDYELRGPVHPDLLQQALRLVADAHPMLKSIIDLDTFSVPLQLVHAGLAIPFEITDVGGRPTAEQDEIIRDWVEAEKRRPFDLGAGPLIRVRAHQRSGQALNLALSFHHALLDGWSVAIVLEAFRSAYAGLVTGAATPPAAEPTGYGTFVQLEQAARSDHEARSFWEDLTTGLTPTLLGAQKPTADAQTQTADRLIPAGDAGSLRVHAAHLGFPLKSLYLAIHLTVLGRLTDQRDVVTGLVTSGRPEVVGSENMAGLFLNTLPFPIQLRQESWPSLIARVYAVEAGSSAYRRFPLADIQAAGRTPLFNVIFNYTDFHVYSSSPDSPDETVTIVGARYFEQTSFDIVIHLHRDHFTDELRLSAIYDSSRVDMTTIADYLDHFLAAVAELATGEESASAADVAAARRPEILPPAARSAGATHASRWAEPGTEAEPRTEVEREVMAIVAQAVGSAGFGVDDSYLQHGVDSITAIRVVARLRKLGFAVGLADVFEVRTVRALAQRLGPCEREVPTGPDQATQDWLAGSGRASLPPGVTDAYPITSLQLNMISATDRDPEQAFYHDVFAFRLAAGLDERRLRQVLRHLLQRYETLRLSFALGEHPVPMQVVHAAVEPHLEVGGEDMDPDALDAWFEHEKTTAFRWEQPHQVRFFAHPHGPDSFTLTVSFHHAILDGWSLSLLMRDLIRMYVTGTPSAEPAIGPPPYRAYVQAELTARKSEAAREFWTRTMAGAPVVSLADRTRHALTSRWSETKVELDDAAGSELLGIALRCRVPLKHVLLACHLCVLAELTGERDLTTGLFTNGRLEVEGGENAVGLFLNFVPLRQKIGTQTWGELIQEVFERDRIAMPYRRYPFDLIRQACGQEQPFPAIFNFTRFTAYSEQQALSSVRWFEHTEFPLLANVGHDLNAERLIITLNADGRAFSQKWIECVASLYSATIARLVDKGPDTPVTYGGKQ